VSERQQVCEDVAAVARRALVQASGGRAVPAELVAAVAEGRGERASVAASCRGLGAAAAPPLDLVLFDTDRIASYVFESSRPPVLAGASAILRGLNDEIGDEYRQEVIFSGGGEGLLLVPAGRGADLCERIRRRFAQRTAGALGVTVDFLPVGPEDFVAAQGKEEAVPAGGARLVSGTQAVLARLRDRVRESKGARLPDRGAVAGGADRCVSCRDRAAGATKSPREGLDGEPEGGLCDPCARRWDAGRKLIAGNSFEDLIDAFKKSLGDQAAGARAQYLGFLYADGNAMGNLFGRLRSLADLRFASRAVARVFARAGEAVERDVELQLPRDRALLSLLGGGDEAIWILPGALAVRAAEQLGRWIEDEAELIPELGPLFAEAGAPGLTFGAGLVLCDLSYPVRYQHELASALLKSAKAMFHDVGDVGAAGLGSSIDFAVLTDSSPLSEDLKTARGLACRTAEPDFVRTCRPFAYQDFTALLKAARRAQEAKLGKSQLYALQGGAAEGRRVFLNYLRYQIARQPAVKRYRKWIGPEAYSTPEAAERIFVRRLPSGGRVLAGTWIPDLLELGPFLDLLPPRAET
jgi:hypothetical protein